MKEPSDPAEKKFDTDIDMSCCTVLETSPWWDFWLSGRSRTPTIWLRVAAVSHLFPILIF